MSWALDASQRRALTQIQTALATKRAHINVAFAALLSELATLTQSVNGLIREYNALQREARAFAEGIADHFNGQFEDRSDGWQQSDKGLAVSDFIGEWQAVDMADVELVELIEPDAPDLSECKAFADLPTEVDI